MTEVKNTGALAVRLIDPVGGDEFYCSECFKFLELEDEVLRLSTEMITPQNIPGDYIYFCDECGHYLAHRKPAERSDEY